MHQLDEFVVLALAAAPVAAQALPSHAVPLNPGLPWTENLLQNVQAAVGDSVHVLGTRLDASNPALRYVLYARSRDGGRTWPLREHPVGYANGLEAVAADGDRVVFIERGNHLGPFAVVSNDGGDSWAPPVQISSGPHVYNERPRVRLHVAGPDVLVLWEENRWMLPGRLWCNRSTDGGATWQAQDARLDVGTTWSPLSTAFIGHWLIVDGITVHALWVFPDGGQAGLPVVTGYQRSTDGGATWLPSAQVIAGFPIVDAVGAGGTLLAVGADGTVLRSVDAGASWTQTVAALGIPRTTSLAMDGAHVLAAGTSTSPGPSTTRMAILANASMDGGATWQTTPSTIVDVAVPATTELQAEPAGAAGVGRSSISLAVPALPNLSGLTVTNQALVFDPGVADGFSLTAAVETWIR